MNKHTCSNICIAALFLFALSIPLLTSLLVDDQELSTAEKRTLATFPGLPTCLGWRQYPEQLEAYYQDHFGFREHLVKWCGLSMLKLGTSASDKVVVGKEGWFFYANRGHRVIEDFRNTDLLAPEHITAWRRDLKEKKRYLDQKGIAYIFAIAPNKHTIYSEYMPSRIRQVGTVSRYDQLVEDLRTSTDITPIDLRTALFRAKKKERIFFRTDTHWNPLGANVAQYEITKALSEQVPEIAPELVPPDQFEWKDEFVGDLVKLMGLSDVVVERHPVYSSPHYVSVQKDRGRIIFVRDCDSDMEALVLGDSFAIAMLDYLAQYFRRTVFIYQHVDAVMLKKYVEEEQPDIVIEERVERSLWFIASPERPLVQAQTEH